jgi:hypothetical protein
MTRFLEVEGGLFVNLAYVVSARPREYTRFEIEWSDYLLTLTDGSKYNTHGRAAGDREGFGFSRAVAPILPAQPGQEALLVYLDTEEDGSRCARPTRVVVDSYPVLGWRLQDDSDQPPEPILPDQTTGRYVMIVLPNGHILSEYFETEWDSRDDMIQAMLSHGQRQWDGAHYDAARRGDGETVGEDR